MGPAHDTGPPTSNADRGAVTLLAGHGQSPSQKVSGSKRKERKGEGYSCIPPQATQPTSAIPSPLPLRGSNRAHREAALRRG